MKQRLFLLQSLWICLGILLTLWFGVRGNIEEIFFFDTDMTADRMFLSAIAGWTSIEFVWLLLFNFLLIRSWDEVVSNLTWAVIGFVIWFITNVLMDWQSTRLSYGNGIEMAAISAIAAVLLFLCPFSAWVGRWNDRSVPIDKMYWRQFGMYVIFPIWGLGWLRAITYQLDHVPITVGVMAGLLIYGWYLDRRFAACVKIEGSDKSDQVSS